MFYLIKKLNYSLYIYIFIVSKKLKNAQLFLMNNFLPIKIYNIGHEVILEAVHNVHSCLKLMIDLFET